MKYIIFIICVFSSVVLSCNNTYLDVNNTEGISAKICLEDNDSLPVSVLGNGKILSTKDIDVSSEKKNHIIIEDYNRDNYKDFSVWHVDEGMGKFKIYRLFIFSPTENKFNEIKSTCGDDFIDIRINGEYLINTFYDDNA
ncbi:hypothetical protein, partial [Enterobacter cloacae complex sp. I2]|uniref:hypothetical protein n=1 Tax=Enterobacter cloacae complex sp. I2 TaxID=2779603 RepID=UPI001D008378